MTSKSDDSCHRVNPANNLEMPENGSYASGKDHPHITHAARSNRHMHVIMDDKGKLLSACDQWLSKMGYVWDQVSSRNFAEFLTPDSLSRFNEHVMPDCSRGQACADISLQLRTKTGSMLDVLFSCTCAIDPSDNQIRINGLMLDFDLCKEFELLHGQSAARFRELILSSGGWFWEVDRDGRYLYASHSVSTILGYEPQELYGKTPFEFMPPDEAERIRTVFLKLAGQKASIVDLENWNLTKDGARVCLLTNGMPLFDQNGEFSGFFGLDKNITKRKTAEAALQQHLDELTALNQLGQMINASLSFETVLDYALEGLLKPLHPDLALIYLLEGDTLQVKRIYHEALDFVEHDAVIHKVGSCLCGLAVTEQKAVYSKDIHFDPRCEYNECKRAGLVSFTALPLLAGGEVLGVIGLGSKTPQDFSERSEFLESLAGVITSGLKNTLLHSQLQKYASNLEQRVEARTREHNVMIQQLIQAKLAAEQANQAKSNFLAKMSHEIRTPLNAVINLSELALLGEMGSEERGYVGSVRDAGHNLLALINSILDISKIEAGHLELEALDFDLLELVKSTVDSLAVQAEEKGLSLRLDTSLENPVYIQGDPIRLQQVFINLINNATKFTDAGGIVVKISGPEPRTAKGQDTRLKFTFSVADTGIGIPLERQDDIFDPFRQIDSTMTRRYGGTGLGLAICKQLVQAMGGDIWLKSRQGQGTTFYFSLSFPAGARSAQAAVPSLPRDQIHKTKMLQVLVVEDNRENLEVATALINKLGHRAQVAEHGRMALELIRKHTFDLVLMDLEMPFMDGLEATRRIRAGEAGTANRDIRIIALTAHALSHYREQCLAAGMNGYIAKPFSLAELGGILGEVQLTSGTLNGADSKEDQMLNKEAALKRFGDDRELYDSVCQVFLSDSPQKLKSMLELDPQTQSEQIAMHAHSVKGNCATIGAEVCQGIALELETASREGDWQQVPALLERLGKSMYKVEQLLKQEYPTNTPD